MTLLGTLCGFGLLDAVPMVTDTDQCVRVPERRGAAVSMSVRRSPSVQILPSKNRMSRMMSTVPMMPIPPWP
jgi:hypothetical protein